MPVTKLLNDYDNYIKRLCSNYLKLNAGYKIEYEDLYQECMLCLCNIVKNNAKPQHKYITTSLHNQLTNYIKKWCKDPVSSADSYDDIFK